MTSNASGIPAAPASTDPQPEPEYRATPCPAWCDLDHDRDAQGMRHFHYSDTEKVEQTGLYVTVEQDGPVLVRVETPNIEEYLLTPAQARNLAAALNRHAELAETIAQRAATPCPAWCAGDHADGETGHRSSVEWVGEVDGVGHQLDTDADGNPALRVIPEISEGVLLNLGELDALIGGLTARRALLAAAARSVTA